MADYTATIEELLHDGFPIFDFDYPMSAELKPDFEQLFCDTFMFREIVCIPPARWQVLLKAKLRTLMPQYQRMLDAEMLNLDPFVTKQIVSRGTSNERATAAKVYASLIEAANGERTRASGTHQTDQTGTVDSDTTGHADGKHHTESSRDTVTLEDETTNRDIHEVVTQDTRGSGNHGKDVVTNGSSRENVNSSQDRITHSETDTTGHVARVGSDYPQGNLNMMRPMYTGEYLTAAGEEDSTSNTKTDGTENITGTQSTTGSTEGTSNETGEHSETAHLEKDTKTDDDTVRHMSGTEGQTFVEDGTSESDTRGTLDTSTVNQEKHKEFASQDKSGESKSALSSSDSSIKDTGKADELVVTGFEGISASDLLMKWRNTFTNTTEELLQRFEPLFWGLIG